MTKANGAISCFFTYFGGKWRLAKFYPKPLYSEIVEPFAGSAGYSLHYPEYRVSLYDRDPVICGVWDYLIRSSERDIMSLPDECTDDHLIDIPQEAAWLIGFWRARAATHPHFGKESGWMKQKKWPGAFWGPHIKSRIARNQRFIRHWKISNLSFEKIANRRATWLVDPPYMKVGSHYVFHDIDYGSLKKFCLSRWGQVMACEGEYGNWLPFQTLTLIKSIGNTVSHEKVWFNQ